MPKGAAAILIAAVCWGSPTLAWDFGEHEEIGQLAYEFACERLEVQIHANEICAAGAADVGQSRAGAEGKDRPALCYKFAVACGGPTQQAGGDAGAMLRRSRIAQVYGQACAIAGDHFGNPEEFAALRAGEDLFSIVDMGVRALSNHDHFHPQVVRRWRDVLGQALAAASDGSSQDPDTVQAAARFELAYYLSAFSSHFLQDSFAAGHMGFNRPASGATPSKTFHDHWNKVGRQVVTAGGIECRTYGDGRWEEVRGPGDRAWTAQEAEDAGDGRLPQITRAGRHYGTCAPLMLDANADAILAVLAEFVTGVPDTHSQRLASLKIPFGARAYQTNMIAGYRTRKVYDFGENEFKPTSAADEAEPSIAHDDPDLFPLRGFYKPAYLANAATPVWHIHWFPETDRLLQQADFEWSWSYAPAENFPLAPRIELFAGYGYDNGYSPGGGHYLPFGLGWTLPLGSWGDGLVSHELEARGAAWAPLTEDAAWRVPLGTELRMSFELAVVSLRFGFGVTGDPCHPEEGAGLAGTFGFVVPLPGGAAGGGPNKD